MRPAAHLGAAVAATDQGNNRCTEESLLWDALGRSTRPARAPSWTVEVERADQDCGTRVPPLLLRRGFDELCARARGSRGPHRGDCFRSSSWQHVGVPRSAPVAREAKRRALMVLVSSTPGEAQIDAMIRTLNVMSD